MLPIEGNRSVFDWDREAKCRERLQNYIDGDYDFESLCPDLTYYANCVIKTAFLRRPTEDELQKAMDEFKKKAKGKRVPDCVNKDTLINITKQHWINNSNAILNDNQGGYVFPKEIDCRDIFWSGFKNVTLNLTQGLVETYMKCVIKDVFRSKPSPEELTVMEDVLIQPTETPGRQLTLTYDLQKFANDIWGGAHMMRASVVLCTFALILLKWVL
ncbi:hypothetical protein Btru_028648 [Bulinus truncatus]|nr:hypothetical protein Btru_028648 [Bulinus truncatus]